MHVFRVWAPKAKQLELTIGEKRIPMHECERGWWTVTVENAAYGTEYCYSIDGGKLRPDPRSAFQPHGVHGPSRLVDHARFLWTDTDFQALPLGSAIIYELHTGPFTPQGTFLSAVERLDYLAELGITHVELLPVNEFPGEWGWGYDGVDLYAPHHTYGEPDDLKAFVDACHQRGLAVLLDVVYNHFGPAGNYLPEFGPYFTDAYSTPWGPAVNLDQSASYEVRRFFVDNALMWLRDYHFDGLRLDAVHAYYDKSAIHLLELLSRETEKLSTETGRKSVLIAESDLNDPRIVSSRERNGFGIDAQWSDDFHHALHTVLTGEQSGYYEEYGTIAQLAKALKSAFVFDGIYSPHRDRIHGKPIGALSAHHFLAYSQNHDQVGNRATGERLRHLVSLGKLKIAAALELLSPFVPMLFQGEEFGASTPFQYFTHHDDEELGRKVSEGRRSEFKAFGWKPEEVPDPQDAPTLQRSKLDWDEVARDSHGELLDWYKRLISLRRSNESLRDGDLANVEVAFDEGARWLLMTRGEIQVACNFSESAVEIAVKRQATPMLASEAGLLVSGGVLRLTGESVAVLTSPLD